MKFNINDIKNKLKSFDKEKIKNINKNEIKEKIKNVKKDDIKSYFNNYKNNLVTIIILPILIIGFWYAISFWFDIKNSYNDIQTNMDNIKIVQSENLKSNIKNNNLRNLDTVSRTSFILNETYSLEDYEDNISNLILFLMFNSNENKNRINDEVFLNENWLSLVDSNNAKKDILLNIDNLNYLIENYEQNIVETIISNKEKFMSSDYINSYLSSLVWEKINIPWEYTNKIESWMLETIKLVLNNIYIYELVFIEESLEKQNDKYKEFYNSYKYPYDKFLSNILLPSINIWQNKFSDKIDVDIFWSNYLDRASYIDLNLVKYWSDYFKSSYKWLLYQWEKNRIDDISVWEFETTDANDIANLSMQLNFWLNNDKSFYWLVSKLTSTSNKKNIMIVSEFTYYIWKNIKNNINTFIEEYEKELEKNNIEYVKDTNIWKKYVSALIYKCIYEEGSFNSLNCGKLFACENQNWCSQNDFNSQSFSSYKKKIRSYNMWNDFYNILKTELIDNTNYSFYDSFIYNYFYNSYSNISDINTLIWARLYTCLIEDGYCADLFSRGNEPFYGIKKSIIEFAWCWSDGNITTSCKHNFIDKFDTNYFIAYTMVDKLENNIDYSYLDRLKDVYKNISWLLKIWEFTFKQENSTEFNNQNNVDYTASSSLQVYYDYIANQELDDILVHIWENKCTSVTDWKKWSIDIAYSYIEWVINNLYESDLDAGWVYDLNQILTILWDLRADYDKKTNLEKALSNIQSYRLLKESSYCY